MNTKIIISVLIALVIGFAAGSIKFAVNDEDEDYGVHMMGNGMGMMSMHLEGKTGDNFDKEFLREMIVHHEGAIDMAKLAQKYAKHDEIKNLANNIIASQSKEIEDMKSWYNTWYK